MALTSTTTFDIIGATQTIIFNNPSQVDEIVYSGNQITFNAISSFNLSKSDLLLYLKFINVYNTLLILNFPSAALSTSSPWPLCSFTMSETSAGVTHITFTQISQGNTSLSINYLPSIASSSVAARGSPVTVTLQEWFTMVNMLNQYSNQILLN